MDTLSEGSRSPNTASHPIEQDSMPDENVAICSSSKDGRRSEVWNYFDKKKVDGVWKAECNYCHKLLGCNPQHGTSNLHDHKNRRCPALREGDVKRVAITKEVMGAPYNQEDGRRALIDMIIKHEYPLNMVEHDGFKRFLNIIQPTFKCPTRNTVKKDIMKIYYGEKKKAMDSLKTCDSRVAVTTDIWTASTQMRGYLTIMAHYVDASWTLQSQILRFAYVPYPHTSEALCEVLMNCLMDWNIDTKLSSITVDNCPMNDLMIELVKYKMHSNSTILSGRFLHMRCLAHILNLIVKDGLTIIKDAIENIRESVSYWTATVKRVEKFEEMTRQLKISVSKALCLDCQTRWNSTYLMLQTTLMYKDVFYVLRQEDKHYKMLLSDSDWQLCAEICEKLKVFYKVTELFSGTKYPTANLCFPNICRIRVALGNWIKSPNEVIANMAKTMLEKFLKYWDDIYVSMGVSVLLDPQYKMKIIEFYFGSIYGNEAALHVQKIHDACIDMLDEYKARNKTNEELANKSNAISSPLVSSQEDLDNDMFIFDAFVKRQKRQSSYFKIELENYLEADTLPRKPDFDVLLWWKLNGDAYPTLKAIAKDLLAVPVSTITSELAFSTSGRIIDSHRNRLHPTSLEALMCIKSWLKVSQNLKDEDTEVEGTLATS